MLDHKAGARGRDRMKELAASNKTAIQANVEVLLASLGREATALERMQAEMLASLFLRAQQLRERGRSDLETLREAVNLMNTVPFLRGSSAPAHSK